MSAETLRDAAAELRGRALVPFRREVWAAVAALLDEVAGDAESNDEHDGFDPYVTITGYGPAVTVARLILGADYDPTDAELGGLAAAWGDPR